MWSDKLGHISERGLKILVECDLFFILKSIDLLFCKYCVRSKNHRIRIGISFARSILILFHFGVCVLLESSGGAKYFVSDS